ncbi:MAG: adaptor protein MecA [Clostridia bacterium]|nr:adaptor protein MecA [Clostridia bacterium]
MFLQLLSFLLRSLGTLSPRKILTVKRKDFPLHNKVAIYSFNNFDAFCDFCDSLSVNLFKNIKVFCKNVSLCLYNDTYYLILSNINNDFEFLKAFYSSISEFATFVSNSMYFEHKLLEHGKIIFKNNAIQNGYKFFGTV